MLIYASHNQMWVVIDKILTEGCLRDVATVYEIYYTVCSRTLHFTNYVKTDFCYVLRL